MIDELHVTNLALIGDATIEPAAGLTVLTGETGAGKSALLSAIKLLVGDLYNNRESVAFAAPHEVPRTLHYLLQPYRKYDVGTSTDVPYVSNSFNRSFNQSFA